MIYGIFSGCYSDWEVIGYFDNKLDADKYCTAFGENYYYVKKIRDLKNDKDLSSISLKYEHEVVFDFNYEGNWIIRHEPDRYECYISDELNKNRIEYLGYKWIAFFINIEKDDRKLAEKIAQDYLYELLSYGDDKKVKKCNVKLMNEKFAEPFRIKEELRKQEEIRQKELAELERLKKKYEK